MRILELPVSDPEKIKSKRVKKDSSNQHKGQLNLFAGGRILPLHPGSPFEEALKRDERGDIKRATELYHKAIEEGDQPDDAYCNLGIMAAKKDRTIEAINYLTLSLNNNPRHIEAHFNLANMYVEAGNKDLGVLHYKMAIQIDPFFTSSYFNLGLTLAADQQYEKAIEAFNQYRKYCSVSQQQTALDMIQKLQGMIT